MMLSFSCFEVIPTEEIIVDMIKSSNDRSVIAEIDDNYLIYDRKIETDLAITQHIIAYMRNTQDFLNAIPDMSDDEYDAMFADMIKQHEEEMMNMGEREDAILHHAYAS